MPHLLSPENLPSAPISDGDCGIVLKADGSFQVFNTHRNFDPNNMSPRQIEQGRVLAAFSLALQIPQIMNILHQIAEDPDIVTVKMPAGLN